MNSRTKDKEKERETFRHESLQDRESLVAYLEALTNGFRDGTLTFCADDESITLNPEGLIQFDVSASRKRDRLRLALKFTWKDADDSDRPADLRITTEG